MFYRGRLACDGEPLADRSEYKFSEAIGMPFNSDSRMIVVLSAIRRRRTTSIPDMRSA